MKDADAAIRFVAQHSPSIPFWPQLPQRSVKEGAILQSLGIHAIMRSFFLCRLPVLDMETPQCFRATWIDFQPFELRIIMTPYRSTQNSLSKEASWSNVFVNLGYGSTRFERALSVACWKATLAKFSELATKQKPLVDTYGRVNTLFIGQVEEVRR